MSTLVNEDGIRAIFPLEIETYPLEMREPIRNLKKNSKLDTQVLFGINKITYSDHHPVYTGEEESNNFDHLSVSCEMGVDTTKCSEINRMLKESLLQFINNINTWKGHVNALEVIESEYKNKGTTSPGYIQYYKAVKWFHKFLKTNILEIKNCNSAQMIQIKATQEIIRLLSSMSCVDNISSLICTFSNKGNMVECMNVTSPTQFWSIMRARTNPATYQQCTAAPTSGSINKFIDQLGEETINKMFQRETRDIRDMSIRKWLYYIKSLTPQKPAFTISDLRNSAKKPQKPTNCFSNTTSSSITTFTLDEFLKYLTTLSPDSTIEWMTNTCHNVNYGFPTNDVGRKFTKLEAGWVVSGTTNTIYVPTWVTLDAIGSHASGWNSTFPNELEEGTLGSGLISDPPAGLEAGLCLVVAEKDRKKIPNYEFTPQCSALFAEFFHGNLHQYRHIRQKYHDELRITNEVHNPYRGLLITREKDSLKKFFKFGYRGSKGTCIRFRVDGGPTLDVY